MTSSLLPDSSGLFEKAAEESHFERWDRMNAAVPTITTAKENPPPSFLPFLIYEFGLGMLTPYVPNLYDIINTGVRWLRIRGTYGAIRQGLSFIGMAAVAEPAWHGRSWWNSMQLRFADLPANDAPLLEQIDGITGLSLPMRSDFRRGVCLYDVGAAEIDSTALDNAMLDCESGVPVTSTKAIWSFGRLTENDHTLTSPEGLSIGNWIAPPTEDGLLWVDMDYPWGTADFAWGDDAASQRRALMAAWFNGRELYLRLMDVHGDVFGYRRVRSSCAVAPAFNGAFQFGGTAYAKSSTGMFAYVEAMTDFDDFDGIALASVTLVSGLERAPGVKPGKLLLRPDEVSLPQSFPAGRFWMAAAGFPAFAEKQVSLPLRRTVREQFKFLIRF